jgi:hypothetical protein
MTEVSCATKEDKHQPYDVKKGTHFISNSLVSMSSIARHDHYLWKEFMCRDVSVQSLKYSLDIVGTVYHLVIYMQSNKIHKVFLMIQFIHR